jgi:hypothetical protein
MNKIKIKKKARWLKPVILASYLEGKDQEIKSSSGKKVSRPYHNQWLCTAAHACHPQLCWEVQIGGSRSRPAEISVSEHLGLSFFLMIKTPAVYTDLCPFALILLMF